VDVAADGPAWSAILIQEGVDTQDGRHIAAGALTWRELPLPLMVLTETGPGGHQGAVIGARIDSIQREPHPQIPGAFNIVGSGRFDTGSVGMEAARLVGNQTLRGVSGDIVDAESTVEVLAEDEDGWPTQIKETLTAGVLAAATVCPIPAFAGCTIALTDEIADDQADDAPALVASAALPAFTVDSGRCLPCEATRDADSLVASGGPMAPPAEWFASPGLDRATPLTITDDGRIFGHLALWGVCHVGIDGTCVMAPRSSTGYGYFTLGAVRTSDGRDVFTGPITLGTGHANDRLDAADTRAHYDNTGTAVADVASGEDEHGIWLAGALRPDCDELTVRKLRASTLSGDWRRIGGYFELVAALAVNRPGFPVARVASGQPMSLVAAGAMAVQKQAAPWQAAFDAVRAEFEERERRRNEELAPLLAEALMRRIRKEGS
jgi:hypothetical protein